VLRSVANLTSDGEFMGLHHDPGARVTASRRERRREEEKRRSRPGVRRGLAARCALVPGRRWERYALGRRLRRFLLVEHLAPELLAEQVIEMVGGAAHDVDRGSDLLLVERLRSELGRDDHLALDEEHAREPHTRVDLVESLEERGRRGEALQHRGEDVEDRRVLVDQPDEDGSAAPADRDRTVRLGLELLEPEQFLQRVLDERPDHLRLGHGGILAGVGAYAFDARKASTNPRSARTPSIGIAL
jgi:hypothetical protein